MNRPTRSIVNSWDVMVLLQSAESLETTAENLRTQTKAMADAPMNVKGWSGESKRACEDRTTSDRDEINRLGTELSAAARVLHDTAAAISPNRSTALTKALGLELDKFSVSDDWTVRDARDYASELNGVEAGSAAEQSIRNDQAKRAEEAKTATLSLQSLADQIGEDDRNGARALNVVFGNAEINTPLSSSFSAGQASRDVQAIMSGTATPEQKERFYRATSLTPEQRAALARGEEAVISKEQFDYLKAIYTPNWGQSAEGSAPYSLDALKRFGDEYSGAERLQLKNALGDGIYLLGNPSLRTDQQVEPTFLAGPLEQMGLPPGPRFVTGGLNELSAPVREVLTSPASSKGQLSASDAGAHSGSSKSVNNLNTFNDLKSLVDILEHRSLDADELYGSDSLQLGSDVDRALIARAGEVAAGREGAYVTDLGTFGHSNIDKSEVEGLLVRMLDVAGTDHIAVHDAVMSGTGRDVDGGGIAAYDLDGNKTTLHDAGTLKNLLSFDWTDDDGKENSGVNKLFNWMPDVASTPDGAPDVRMADSVRSGQIATALGEYLGDNKDYFADVHGDQALGELNPELTRTLAKSIAPYLAEMAGADQDIFQTRGASQLSDAHDLKGLFQVLDTDPEAGRIVNTNAMMQAGVLEQVFGADDSRSGLGKIAGRLHGAMTAGLNDMLDEDVEDERYKAARDYARYGAAFDSVAALGTAIPGLHPGLSSLVDLSSSALKLSIIGDPPNASDISPDVKFNEVRASVFRSTNMDFVYEGMMEGYLKNNPDFVDSPEMREIYGDRMDDPAFVESLRRDGLSPDGMDRTVLSEVAGRLFGARDNDFLNQFQGEMERHNRPTPNGGGW